MKRFTFFICVIFAVALVFSLATATVPRLINYQGILTDDTGTPITGTHDLTFTIYPDSTLGATVLWSEVHTGVEINAGLFNVILGKTVTFPDSLLADGDRWMGITVDGGTEMTPRMQLTSVPWALRAAVDVGGGDHAATHQNGGADELNVAGLSGVLADPQTPATHADSHSDGSSDPISHGNLAGIGETDHHSNANDPTASEKAALAGEGTPSGTNKYTTKSYVDGELAGKADAADVTPLEKVIKDVAVVDNAGTYEIPADYNVEDMGSLKIEHLPNLVAKLGGTTQALVTANVMRLTIEVEAYAENTMATFNGPCWTAPGTLGETTGKAHWAVEFKNADGSSYSGVDWKLLKVTTYLK